MKCDYCGSETFVSGKCQTCGAPAPSVKLFDRRSPLRDGHWRRYESAIAKAVEGANDHVALMTRINWGETK